MDLFNKNMNFLLVAINSKYIHSNPAVYSLKAYAGPEFEDCVSIAEYTINQPIGRIMADIFSRKPDYIGFSCYIWNWKVVEELLENIAKVLPNVGIFLGGPEVSYTDERAFSEYKNILGIMRGEGEITFKKLLEDLRDGKYVKTNISDLPNMDDLPFIYNLPGCDPTGNNTGITKESSKSLFADRIIYYESSRGCPFNCSYCLSAAEHGLRFRSIEKVLEHLDFFLERKVMQVKFLDRTFNANHEHAMAIWKHIKENDNGVTNFHFEIAADIMTEDEIDIISSMRPGLVQLEIGVQSTNPKTLEAVNRKSDIEKIARVTERLVSAHTAHVHLDLIAGLPFEDMESFKKSFNDLFAMKPNQLQLGFLKVLKGAPIDSQTKKYGIEYMSEPPYEVLRTDWLGYDDIIKLKRVEEVLEIYYNSAQFTCSLPYLIDFFDTPFDFFDSLGEFFERKGYFVSTPARARRYDILLEFVGEGVTQSPRVDLHAGIVEHLREKLTFDYYLREKPKSKPAFVNKAPERVEFDYEHRDPITYNATVKSPY